ncbi:hypothetical protein CN101_00795, partial [Sinorhizobium meliloti]
MKPKRSSTHRRSPTRRNLGKREFFNDARSDPIGPGPGPGIIPPNPVPPLGIPDPPPNEPQPDKGPEDDSQNPPGEKDPPRTDVL